MCTYVRFYKCLTTLKHLQHSSDHFQFQTRACSRSRSFVSFLQLQLEQKSDQNAIQL